VARGAARCGTLPNHAIATSRRTRMLADCSLQCSPWPRHPRSAAYRMAFGPLPSLALWAVPVTDTCHRNKKMWRPQNKQRCGRTIHRSALSIVFRTPTALKSTDLQCEQPRKNTITPISFVTAGFYGPNGLCARRSNISKSPRVSSTSGQENRRPSEH
jgi:hypothetical protein